MWSEEHGHTGNGCCASMLCLNKVGEDFPHLCFSSVSSGNKGGKERIEGIFPQLNQGPKLLPLDLGRKSTVHVQGHFENNSKYVFFFQIFFWFFCNVFNKSVFFLPHVMLIQYVSPQSFPLWMVRRKNVFFPEIQNKEIFPCIFPLIFFYYISLAISFSYRKNKIWEESKYPIVEYIGFSFKW